MPLPRSTLGVILAGGLARRMGGGDKPLLSAGATTLLKHAIDRLAPQCDELILNANGDPARFCGSGLPVVPDCLQGHLGPLAGILSALEWAATHRPSLPWVVSVPGDTPFAPEDLVQRLHEVREGEGKALACAASAGRLHFAVGLWPVHLRHDLRHALVETGLRSIRDWTSLHPLAEAVWPAEPFDPFFNVNTPDDLAQARTLIERQEHRSGSDAEHTP